MNWFRTSPSEDTSKSSAQSQMTVDATLAHQKQTMDDQDKMIDKMIESLGRIKSLAEAFGPELDNQNKELIDLDNEVHLVNGKLKRETKRVEKLLDKKPWWQKTTDCYFGKRMMEDQENYDYTADYDPSNSSCSGSMFPDDHSANCTMSTIDVDAVALTPKKMRARSSSFTTASTSNGIQKKTPQRSTLPRSVLTSPRSSTKKTGGRSRQTPSRIMNQVADQVCKKIVRRKLELDDEDFLCKETDGTVKLLTGESVLDRNGCELKMDMDMTDLQKRYIMHVKGSVVAGEGLMNQLSTFSLN